MTGEASFAEIICLFLLGGVTEQYQANVLHDSPRSGVYADCLTDEFAIEIGFDDDGSLDSLQQARDYAHFFDRQGVIILVDEVSGEHGTANRLERTAREDGIIFVVLPAEFLRAADTIRNSTLGPDNWVNGAWLERFGATELRVRVQGSGSD